ncbi:pilus assembly protein CpaE [Actinotalea ferrariae]|uniref:pilus assembly protein CpaE n=1 Tax=Actinotalea ferrariae TaxID=1386098 RepID=UPI001C8CB012|nr:pilus assembly protein CpaE [Actinotalea ferrariae]MBX9245558.1 pilus assembly protein CpaE [Actinotalea ferrariae]
MISRDLASDLRDAGLQWRPTAGDRFVIPQPELDGELFTLSEMTIEAREYPTGTILGFNGTTEWALDSVAQDDALWMPREDQLRDLLGGTFRSLEGPADGRDGFRVTTAPVVGETTFEALTAADAYGHAVLALVRHALLDVDA